MSLDIRNYDNGHGNPMTMPWEIWDDKNTIRETTVGIEHKEYIGAEVNNSGGYFIGVSISAFAIIGGKIKIGFNIGG